MTLLILAIGLLFLSIYSFIHLLSMYGFQTNQK